MSRIDQTAETLEFVVRGMTCSHCVPSVREEVSGVCAVDVEFASGRLTVTGGEIDKWAMRAAVADAWTTRVRLDEAGSYRLFADFSHEHEALTLATDLRVDGRADLEPLPAAQATAISDAGYDVRLDTGAARRGEEANLRFTITKDGQTVHTEPYLGAGGHLVALRDGDLAFLHVHPTEQHHGDEAAATDEHEDTVGFAATFPTAGRYRLFLQFQHDGRVQTVAFTQKVK